MVPPHSARLMWNPSASAVFGYYVYRAQTQNGAYSKLNSTPVTITQFTDFNVAPGQTYIYWVTAVGPNTIESPISDSISATIPTP